MRVLLLVFPLTAGVLFFGGGSLAPAQDPSSPPLPLPMVKSTVQQHFAAIPDFEKGDLITQDQVAAVLAQLEAAGWKVADGPQILSQCLTAKDFLAVQLRSSKQGLVFMRTVSAMPMAYDRLDRLALLPNGKRTIHDMIHKPGGAEMIRYMTTAKGGGELGKMLAHAPSGRDFNKPTGRIYTAEQLLARLETSYHREFPPAQEPSSEPHATGP
ncbi:MAG: hypothetical protein RBS80_03015 [Thermoguttaceae bacterium]|jgi:hypothetical protein|nr:hypothetical protein [Thermoguttaceae bacterium]